MFQKKRRQRIPIHVDIRDYLFDVDNIIIDELPTKITRELKEDIWGLKINCRYRRFKY